MTTAVGCGTMEPPHIVARVPCRGVVLGGYHSERETVLEIDSAGGLCANVITEQKTGARVLFSKGDVAACAVTGDVIALKLRACSGFSAMYINPEMEETSTVVVDPVAEAWQDSALRREVAGVCAAHFPPMEPSIAAILHCKLRLMKAQRESGTLKARLAQHEGDRLDELSDDALAEQHAFTLQALRDISKAIDNHTSEQLSPHMCVCCTVAPSTVLVVPCLHLALCEACYRILLTKDAGMVLCPVCRADVVETKTVYLP